MHSVLINAPPFADSVCDCLIYVVIDCEHAEGNKNNTEDMLFVKPFRQLKANKQMRGRKMIIDKNVFETSKLWLLETFAGMMNRMVFLVNKCNLDLGDSCHTQEFSKSSRELVTILFAVVLGLSLGEFKNIDQKHYIVDCLLLIIGHITVVLSWWFYHKGTIAGPKENNVLLYVIDYVLVIVYWLMINLRGSTQILFIYAAMFFLYWMWELIRTCQKLPESDIRKVTQARSINSRYLLFSLSVAVLFYFRNGLLGSSIRDERVFCLVVISVLVLSYRIPISKIYRKPATNKLQSA